MDAWHRGWLAYGFGLKRLTFATVFLGAFIGLNLQAVGPMQGRFSTHGPRQPPPLGTKTTIHFPQAIRLWGWPLPMIAETEEFGRSPVAEWAFSMAKKAEAGRINACGFTDLFNKRVVAAEASLIPWTHHGYHWVDCRAFLEPTNNTSIQNGVLDTLFAILVLLLVLFLQIPRRKVVAKEE